MTTPINSWVASWLCVHRAQPEGNWIIHGNEAERDKAASQIIQDWKKS